MLNQVNPPSNILLKRRISRNKALETLVADTSGDEWMKPFADHLGIIPDEFTSWRDVIGNRDSSVLSVEGDIDRAYFEHLRSKFSDKFPVAGDVKILQYGGRDSLKNTTL